MELIKIHPDSDFSNSVIPSGRLLTYYGYSNGSSGNLALRFKDHSGNFGTVQQGISVDGTTAEASDVLEGKYFYNSAGVGTSGTIPQVSATISANVVTVPQGYIASPQTLTVEEAGSIAKEGNVVTIPVGYISSQRVEVIGSAVSGTTYTPTTSSYTIPADSYLTGAIVIEGSEYLVGGNIRRGVTIFSVSGTFDGVITSDATAEAADLLQGKTAYGSAGTLISGTIPTVSATLEANVTTVPEGYIASSQTLTVPEADDNITSGLTVIVPGGYITSSRVTVLSDDNLVASNIKDGVSIFGVSGTFTNDGDATASDIISGKKAYVQGSLVTGSIQTVSATLEANVTTVPSGYIATSQTLTVPEAGAITSNNLTVTVPVGYIASSRTATLSDENLTAGNIKDGVSIFGVSGTFTHGATATSATILYGYTAYVNGELVTGAYVEPSSESSSESGSGVEDVILGVVDSQGKFQPFVFSGTVPTDSGEAETVSNYNTWNSTLPSPVPSGSADYYKCASVNTSAYTWDGYKALLSYGEYSFESSVTSGLAYDSSAIVPEVGGIYTDGALVKAELYQGFPTSGLVFYAPLQTNSTATTGQSVTTEGEWDASATYGTVDGIQCVTLNNTRLVYGTTGLPTGTNPWTMSLWAKWGGQFGGSGAHIMFWGRSSSGQSALLGVMDSSEYIYAAIHSKENCESNVQLTTWKHIAATFNGSDLILYINGQSSATVTELTGVDIQLVNCVVGGHVEASDFYFNGSVTAVRIYNRVLTVSEIGKLSTEFTPTAQQQGE